LAVDVRLIGTIQDGPAKMIAFCDVEKLRSARKIVEFKAANPGATADPRIYQSFIASDEQRIESERKTL
jgi:hypothetical protein